MRNEPHGCFEAMVDDDGEIINMPPSHSTLIAPPEAEDGMVPVFNTESDEWELLPVLPDTDLYYRDELINNKDDVNRITEKAIRDLGEDKVKTLKMIAGTKSCPEWTAFVKARKKLIHEGNDFILNNALDLPEGV